MKHIIMYAIIALVVVAALTHPAGATAEIQAGTKGVTGIGGLLSGQGSQGGVKGSATSAGAYTFA